MLQTFTNEFNSGLSKEKQKIEIHMKRTNRGRNAYQTEKHSMKNSLSSSRNLHDNNLNNETLGAVSFIELTTQQTRKNGRRDHRHPYNVNRMDQANEDLRHTDLQFAPAGLNDQPRRQTRVSDERFGQRSDASLPILKTDG